MKSLFKKLFLVFTLTLVVTLNLSAQSIYAELGGPGIASFNIDARFTKNSGGLGGRIGVGGFKIEDVGVVFVPLGVNYLFSKDNKNFFEVGLGVTPTFGGDGSSSGMFSTTFGHGIFGYRIEPPDGGLTFRIFLCPIFRKEFFIPYYGGLSMGYKI
ncbi:MAG: hypothetical protein IPI59_02060 [Sphingobacteriales bacterium]|jgi:hypothetical protein|nr:hypothetical protein [Sphingobacteriales bacterium]MBP9142407.1 hypothetical protein [Chitinophagales bacterium]MDA0197515.1 hypothetical protein [Bacteroidota bacterium]MBK6890599.1 hypothetical protein [Sphingobacteriales bacterium]MBK7526350.1 hypothetical protein [Sphingobacteriales bacterium]